MGRGERLMTVLLVALPLAAITAVAAVLCWILGATTHLPGWGVVAISVPAAALLVGGFIGTMGNDMMDVIVGSVIVLVMTVILVPLFSRAREATQRTREKEALRQQRPWVPAPPHPAPPASKTKAAP